MTMKASTFIVLVILIAFHGSGNCRPIGENNDLLSDGMHRFEEPILKMKLDSTSVTCTLTYGFLPCTGTVWGELFLFVIYQILMSFGGKYVSSGSDMFFKMFGTGIFGAGLFQIIGMIPQIVMVLVIAVSGSSDTVESMAAMGMAMLAGTAVFQLTLVWGSVVAFGSYDLSSKSEAKKSFSLTGYGVGTDVETSYTARIMLVTMIPFLILTIAKFLDSTSAIRVVVLVSLVVSIVLFFVYCFYQAFEPWIQSRRLEYLMRKYIESHLLHNLLTANGTADEHRIRELFHKIDLNHNSSISATELRALILGAQIQEVGLDEDDYVEKVMKTFDISRDSTINEEEFVAGLSKWLLEANNHSALSLSNDKSKSTSSTSKTLEEPQNQVTKKKDSQGSTNPWLSYSKAVFLVIFGTAITALLAQPLMQTIMEFSSEASLPSFMISYIVIPLSMGYRQAWLAIKSARERNEKAVSLTLSQIYGGVFMNNIMGLSIFLLLVYLKDLTWDVSAEVLVVLIICTVMGVWTSCVTKFPFWTSIVAILLYPISLVLLYVLTEVLGWA